MINDLKPCPFCGNKDVEVEREGTNRQSCIIACGNCGCRVESNEIGHGRDWNMRDGVSSEKPNIKPIEKIDYDEVDVSYDRIEVIKNKAKDGWKFKGMSSPYTAIFQRTTPQ